ncbi:sensor histidine kinase [Coriobacteriia bacterium Es71-Z0120]|uniref:sensor histidine kinase n=1 Tax=Parvivirga hydrogeniphila TaxID=2939460 RepID=UPI002260B213|nr:sensor histidine kinase [Parvivirga hydrogeniphila]MCL4078060.1 sensor histidine kinase [Parvivirga hydrogeniphila]
MDAASISGRLRRADPLLVDATVATALTVSVWLVIAFFSHARPQHLPPVPNFALSPEQARPPAFVAYALAALTFMPLAARRTVPWLALVLSTGGALAYQLTRGLAPAPVTFGPMLAMYSYAAYTSRRRGSLIALLVAGTLLAVVAFAFSSSVRWVAEAAGTFVMLAAAALLGEAERNRRKYIAEVERRAELAERTREEEALRRVDEERVRIAREIHDAVAHSLSIIAVQASAASAMLDKDPARARESIDHVRSASKQALSELRSTLGVLRTGEPNAPLEPAQGLAALDHLVERVRAAGLAVDLRVAGDTVRVPAFASVSAYRIAQESLTNVVRHAHASAAAVTVMVTPNEVTVEVVDGGTGAAAPFEPGHGIRGMRERAEALGGVFEAGPRIDGGFRVFASIPFVRSE